MLVSWCCVSFKEPTSLLGVALRPSVASRPNAVQSKIGAMLNHILGLRPLYAL